MRLRRFSEGLWWQLGVLVAVIVIVAAFMVEGARGQQRLGADEVDCAKYKCVALTFDDGPTPFTDRLLQVLADQGAKATFFLIGNKVAADPDAARRIADAGMEVGSHTWEHPNMTTIRSPISPANYAKPPRRLRPQRVTPPTCTARPADYPTTPYAPKQENRVWLKSFGTSFPSIGSTTPTWQPPPTCSKPKSNPARWCYCTTPTPAQSTWCINFFPY